MSNGSHDREHPRDVQCSHCGRYFRNDGIHAHKSACPFEAVDDTIVPLAGDDLDDGGGEVSPSETDQDPDPPPDGVGDGGQPRSGDVDVETSEGPTAETDGGPREPPTPEVDDSDDDPVDSDGQEGVDDLPDRFVATEEYVEAVEEAHDGEVDNAALRERLSEYDVVDTVATNADTLVAYKLGEVPT